MVCEPQPRMRLPLLAASLGLVLSACVSDATTEPSPYDDDYGVTTGDINAGSPENGSLPDDNKADAEDTAVHFLKANEDIWTKWVSPEIAAKVKATLG